MNRSLFLMTLLSISALTFCGTCQAQLVTNGTFDSDANGWSWENIDGAGGWRSTNGNPGGNFILNSNGNLATDPSISQLVTGLTPSSTYTLSGDFASVYSAYGSPSALSFGIYADGVLIASYSRPGGEDIYGSFSVDIYANDSDILLSFRGEMDGDDSSYRIDNISLNFVAALPVVTIAATTPASEPATDGMFIVSSDAAAGAGGLIVHYAVDAASTATSGADFSALSGSVTIAEGTTSAGINVSVIDDSEVESTESVAVNLTADTAYTLGSPAAATVNITDDDVETTPLPIPTTPVPTLSQWALALLIMLIGSAVFSNRRRLF